MGEPADQDDGDAGLVVAALVAVGPVVLGLVAVENRVLVGDEAEAGGGGDGENGDAGIEEADEAADGSAGDARDIARAEEETVADHAAHAGGQRPARGRGQGAGDGGSRSDADDPEAELQCATIEDVEADEPERPDHRRKQ